MFHNARFLSKTDLQNVANLNKSVSKHPWTYAMFCSSYAVGDFIYGVMDNDQIIAFCVWNVVYDDAELLNISVAHAYQRRGIARYLILEMIEKVKVSGVNRVLLEVAESNISAQGLYEDLGFICIHRRKNYYRKDQCIEDALILEKILRV